MPTIQPLRLFSILTILLFSTHLSAQSSNADNKPPELLWNLKPDSSAFIKVSLLNQVWVRYAELNPNTLIFQEEVNNYFDIGLRRTRAQANIHIDKRTTLYFQYGMNNFNWRANNEPNRKNQSFFHDALCQYKVIDKDNYLFLGGGLTIVNGLSRFSSPSVSSIMTMDVPIFAQASVDVNDIFSRKLSIYADGQLGPLHYRAALSNPFAVTTNPFPSIQAEFHPSGTSLQGQGLLMYNFFDKETSASPGYWTGTYLGTKKVFNIEAGVIHQPDATWRESPITLEPEYFDMTLWSVAAFLDMPLNRYNGTAISAYLGYFSTDYGFNYLRYNNIMNPGTGSTNAIAPGTSFPMFGSGQVLYAQLGYLFSSQKHKPIGPQPSSATAERKHLPNNTKPTHHPVTQWMPYASMSYANYDAVSDPVLVWNVGLNCLLKGHNSKLTLDYQNRPAFDLPTSTSIARRSQILLQWQLFM